MIHQDLKFSCGELFTETSLFHEHLLKLLRLYCQNIAKEGEQKCQFKEISFFIRPFVPRKVRFDLSESSCALCKASVLNFLFYDLLSAGLTEGKPPGWLTPLILLFDNHEKMATMVQRRGALPKVTFYLFYINYLSFLFCETNLDRTLTFLDKTIIFYFLSSVGAHVAVL